MKRINLKPTKLNSIKSLLNLLFYMFTLLVSTFLLINPFHSPHSFSFYIFQFLIIIFMSYCFIRVLPSWNSIGYIEIDENGIIINVYYTYGFISWNNLAKIEENNTTSIKTVGLTLKEIDKYIDSRQNIVRQKFYTGNLIIYIVLGLLYLLGCVLKTFFKKYKDLDINFKKLIENDTEIMKHNFVKFGSHILIDKHFIPNIDEFWQTINLLAPQKE